MKKVLASLLIFSLICGQVFGGVTANTAPSDEKPSDFSSLTIPDSLGHVEDIYVSPHAGAPWIIHIKDAHSNYAAQQNIRNLLVYLSRRHDCRLVGVEGASTVLDRKILTFFEDGVRNRQAAEFLASKGELSGVDLFLLEEEDAVAFGIEKPELYAQNLAAFRQVLSAEDETRRLADYLEGQLELAMPRLLDKNLLKLVKLWKGFEERQSELLNYVSVLAKEAEKHLGLDFAKIEAQIDWPHLWRLLKLKESETKLNPQQIQAEQQALLASLRESQVDPALLAQVERLRPGQQQAKEDRSPRLVFEKLFQEASPRGFKFEAYPAYALYAQYLILQSEIQAAGLFEEMSSLTDRLIGVLAQTEDEKRVVAMARDLKMFRKIYHLEMVRADADFLQERKEEIRPTRLAGRIEELKERARIRNHKSDIAALAARLNPLLETVEQFYRLAGRRDEELTSRALAEIEKRGAKRIALVTGGFHTDGIKAKLKRHGVSFAVISPKIDAAAPADNFYMEVMMNRSRTLFDRAQLSPAEKPVALVVYRALAGPEAAARRGRIWWDGILSVNPAPEEVARIAAAHPDLQGYRVEVESLNNVPQALRIVSPEGETVRVPVQAVSSTVQLRQESLSYRVSALQPQRVGAPETTEAVPAAAALGAEAIDLKRRLEALRAAFADEPAEAALEFLRRFVIDDLKIGEAVDRERLDYFIERLFLEERVEFFNELLKTARAALQGKQEPVWINLAGVLEAVWSELQPFTRQARSDLDRRLNQIVADLRAGKEDEAVESLREVVTDKVLFPQSEFLIDRFVQDLEREDPRIHDQLRRLYEQVSPKIATEPVVPAGSEGEEIKARAERAARLRPYFIPEPDEDTIGRDLNDAARAIEAGRPVGPILDRIVARPELFDSQGRVLRVAPAVLRRQGGVEPLQRLIRRLELPIIAPGPPERPALPPDVRPETLARLRALLFAGAPDRRGLTLPTLISLAQQVASLTPPDLEPIAEIVLDRNARFPRLLPLSELAERLDAEGAREDFLSVLPRLLERFPGPEALVNLPPSVPTSVGPIGLAELIDHLRAIAVILPPVTPLKVDQIAALQQAIERPDFPQILAIILPILAPEGPVLPPAAIRQIAAVTPPESIPVLQNLIQVFSRPDAVTGTPSSVPVPELIRALEELVAFSALPPEPPAAPETVEPDQRREFESAVTELRESLRRQSLPDVISALITLFAPEGETLTLEETLRLIAVSAPGRPDEFGELLNEALDLLQPFEAAALPPDLAAIAPQNIPVPALLRVAREFLVFAVEPAAVEPPLPAIEAAQAEALLEVGTRPDIPRILAVILPVVAPAGVVLPPASIRQVALVTPPEVLPVIQTLIQVLSREEIFAGLPASIRAPELIRALEELIAFSTLPPVPESAPASVRPEERSVLARAADRLREAVDRQSLPDVVSALQGIAAPEGRILSLEESRRIITAAAPERPEEFAGLLNRALALASPIESLALPPEVPSLLPPGVTVPEILRVIREILVLRAAPVPSTPAPPATISLIQEAAAARRLPDLINALRPIVLPEGRRLSPEGLSSLRLALTPESRVELVDALRGALDVLRAPETAAEPAPSGISIPLVLESVREVIAALTLSSPVLITVPAATDINQAVQAGDIPAIAGLFAPVLFPEGRPATAENLRVLTLLTSPEAREILIPVLARVVELLAEAAAAPQVPEEIAAQLPPTVSLSDLVRGLEALQNIFSAPAVTTGISPVLIRELREAAESVNVPSLLSLVAPLVTRAGEVLSPLALLQLALAAAPEERIEFGAVLPQVIAVLLTAAEVSGPESRLPELVSALRELALLSNLISVPVNQPPAAFDVAAVREAVRTQDVPALFDSLQLLNLPAVDQAQAVSLLLPEVRRELLPLLAEAVNLIGRPDLPVAPAFIGESLDLFRQRLVTAVDILSAPSLTPAQIAAIRENLSATNLPEVARTLAGLLIPTAGAPASFVLPPGAVVLSPEAISQIPALLIEIPEPLTRADLQNDLVSAVSEALRLIQPAESQPELRAAIEARLPEGVNLPQLVRSAEELIAFSLVASAAVPPDISRLEELVRSENLPELVQELVLLQISLASNPVLVPELTDIIRSAVEILQPSAQGTTLPALAGQIPFGLDLPVFVNQLQNLVSNVPGSAPLAAQPQDVPEAQVVSAVPAAVNLSALVPAAQDVLEAGDIATQALVQAAVTLAGTVQPFTNSPGEFNAAVVRPLAEAGELVPFQSAIGAALGALTDLPPGLTLPPSLLPQLTQIAGLLEAVRAENVPNVDLPAALAALAEDLQDVAPLIVSIPNTLASLDLASAPEVESPALAPVQTQLAQLSTALDEIITGLESLPELAALPPSLANEVRQLTEALNQLAPPIIVFLSEGATPMVFIEPQIADVTESLTALAPVLAQIPPLVERVITQLELEGLPPFPPLSLPVNRIFVTPPERFPGGRPVGENRAATAVQELERTLESKAVDVEPLTRVVGLAQSPEAGLSEDLTRLLLKLAFPELAIPEEGLIAPAAVPARVNEYRQIGGRVYGDYYKVDKINAGALIVDFASSIPSEQELLSFVGPQKFDTKLYIRAVFYEGVDEEQVKQLTQWARSRLDEEGNPIGDRFDYVLAPADKAASYISEVHLLRRPGRDKKTLYELVRNASPAIQNQSDFFDHAVYFADQAVLRELNNLPENAWRVYFPVSRKRLFQALPYTALKLVRAALTRDQIPEADKREFQVQRETGLRKFLPNAQALAQFLSTWAANMRRLLAAA